MAGRALLDSEALVAVEMFDDRVMNVPVNREWWACLTPRELLGNCKAR